MRLRLSPAEDAQVTLLVPGKGMRSDTLAALALVGFRYPEELLVISCTGGYDWTRLPQSSRSDVDAHLTGSSSIGDVVAAAVRVGLNHVDEVVLPRPKTTQQQEALMVAL